MKIGIIGAGSIGTALAKKLVKAGYQIEICNSRGPETLKDLVTELGIHATAVTLNEVVANPVVILSVRWANSEAILKKESASLKGKIVIDTTNPIINQGDLADLGNYTSSEIIASFIPGSKVVKAFSSLRAQWISDDPQVGNGKRVVLVSGDDQEAKSTVTEIIAAIGFSPIDIGDLKTGGALQQAGKPLALKNLINLS